MNADDFLNEKLGAASPADDFLDQHLGAAPKTADAFLDEHLGGSSWSWRDLASGLGRADNVLFGREPFTEGEKNALAAAAPMAAGTAAGLAALPIVGTSALGMAASGVIGGFAARRAAGRPFALGDELKDAGYDATLGMIPAIGGPVSRAVTPVAGRIAGTLAGAGASAVGSAGVGALRDGSADHLGLNAGLGALAGAPFAALEATGRARGVVPPPTAPTEVGNLPLSSTTPPGPVDLLEPPTTLHERAAGPGRISRGLRAVGSAIEARLPESARSAIATARPQLSTAEFALPERGGEAGRELASRGVSAVSMLERLSTERGKAVGLMLKDLPAEAGGEGSALGRFLTLRTKPATAAESAELWDQLSPAEQEFAARTQTEYARPTFAAKSAAGVMVRRQGEYIPVEPTEFYAPLIPKRFGDVAPGSAAADLATERATEVLNRQATPGAATDVSRRPGNAGDVLTDVHQMYRIQAQRDARTIALSQAFPGEPTPLVVGRERILVGKTAKDLWDQLPDEESKAVAGLTLRDLYAPGPATAFEHTAQAASRWTSEANLGLSAIPNASQSVTATVMLGPKYTLEGRRMWVENPVMREVAEQGASRPALGAELAEQGVRTEIPGYRMMAGVEYVNRAQASAGVVPYARDLSIDLAAKRAAGREFSAGDARKAADLGVEPDWLAARNGTFTPSELGRVWNRFVQNTQFLSAPGLTPAAFRNPAAKVAGTQWLTFPVRQWNLVMRDILELRRSADPELRSLGNERLRRFIAFQPLASGLSSAARRLVSGAMLPALTGNRDPLDEAQQIGEEAIGSAVGYPADAALGAYGAASDLSKWAGLGALPGASPYASSRLFPSPVVDSVRRAAKDPIRAAAYLDPRIAPFAPGASNLFREFRRD